MTKCFPFIHNSVGFGVFFCRGWFHLPFCSIGIIRIFTYILTHVCILMDCLYSFSYANQINLATNYEGWNNYLIKPVIYDLVPSYIILSIIYTDSILLFCYWLFWGGGVVTFISDKNRKKCMLSHVKHDVIEKSMLVHTPECISIAFDLKDSLSFSQFPRKPLYLTFFL